MFDYTTETPVPKQQDVSSDTVRRTLFTRSIAEFIKQVPTNTSPYLSFVLTSPQEVFLGFVMNLYRVNHFVVDSKPIVAPRPQLSSGY
ncbi:hypothetical protein D3C84_991210 [compost metagenome]